MGTGYTRNDTSNNIADGNVINASDLDGEYDAIESAFGTSGHTHDGTSGEGGPVTVLGPVQDFVASASEIKPKTDNTLDIGTSSLEFKDLYLDGLAYIDGLGETMLVSGSSAIQFRDTAISINSSTDGQLDIDADTEIEITSPTVDINASTVVNISTDLIVGDDLTLQSDAAVLNFGADSDVSLTHVADTGLLLNASSAIQFRDSALAINSSADGQLDIIADTQLEITTPTLELNSDAQVIAIGADGDVTITHEADTGLKMQAASGFELNLQTGDTSVESGNVLGKITFNAPSESSGSDAILDGAAIEAVAEGTFSSTVNTTKLSFKTGASEAATEKMSLSSGGVLNVDGGITVDNITIDGTEIDLSSGSLTIDVAGAIELDSDTGVIDFDDDTLNFGRIENSSSDFKLESRVQDKDIIFTGNDGGSGITALTLDMSEAGAASFNSTATFGGAIAVGQSSLSGGSVIADFHTSGSSVGTQLAFANDHNTDKFFVGIEGNTTGNAMIYQQKDADINFYTNNNLRMTLNNNGNLILDDGNLQTNTSGTSNFRAGVNAGDAIQSGGNYNVLIGDEAGTAITTGDGNVAIGYTALDAEDANSYNVAIGFEALTALNAGTDAYNVAVGTSAGASLVTGYNNTFVGTSAGQLLGTSGSGGNHCTFIGYQAGFDGDTIIQTTAVGAKALHEITTGNYNVAVGFEALEETTVGDYNTAVGTFALKLNVNGDRSTAFGYGALFNQGAGSTVANADYQNVAMGMHAAYNLSTGKKNVYIGYEAANGNSSSKATGDNNVFIGNESGHDITSGGSNTLVGSQTGDAMTTGSLNTAFGYNALSSEDTHNYNVAIGANALETQDAGANAYNTAVGYGAGKDVTTGKYSTYIGGEAGQNITTGTYNVAVGQAALNDDTVGQRTTVVGYGALATQNRATLTDSISYNTALGYAAGSALSTAQSCTLLGYGAGDSINTGGSNVCVGVSAGQALTSGEQNVALGSGTLNTDDQGDRSVAVGYIALYNQNIGDEISYNTAVGYYSGGTLSTARFNTFLGYQAGMSSTNSGTGNSNTAIGYIAGSSMTSAANNTLVGRNAGDLITTGGGNVCIGADTGSTGGANLESGDDNIIIGNLAQVAAHNQSNGICIGHNIAASANDFSFGKASNVVTNDFDTDANWSRSSDVRKKREIYDQNLGLDFINDLRTVSFQWKPSNEFPKEWNDYSEENTMNTDVVMHGFIAQEVKEALDKHASERDSNFSGWKEGEDGMQHTSREMFVIPLIKAVQELSSKVTELQEEIKVLKGE